MMLPSLSVWVPLRWRWRWGCPRRSATRDAASGAVGAQRSLPVLLLILLLLPTLAPTTRAQKHRKEQQDAQHGEEEQINNVLTPRRTIGEPITIGRLAVAVPRAVVRWWHGVQPAIGRQVHEAALQCQREPLLKRASLQLEEPRKPARNSECRMVCRGDDVDDDDHAGDADLRSLANDQLAGVHRERTG